MSRRRRNRRIVFAAILFLVLYPVGRVVKSAVDYNTPSNMNTYRIAYAHAPYANTEFAKESAEAESSLRFDTVADRWRGDYHGVYYNIIDGYRQVTDTPAHWSHTIWLFGSSTIRDSAVPDYYTKASYLQRLLPTMRVLNMADDGRTIAQEVRFIDKAPIQSGDVVIMFDGDHELDAVEYGPLILKARQIATSRQAIFLHFLEPHIWSMPLSHDEELLVGNTNYTPVGEPEATLVRWPALQAVAAALRARGVASFDLTHVLDPIRASGIVVHIDHVHTTERGNEIIARALYDALTFV